MSRGAVAVAFELLLSWLFLSEAAAGGYYDYNGYRYRLADASIDVASSTPGDDCESLPCPYFIIPSTCTANFPTTDLATVAVALQWGAVYLAGSNGLLYSTYGLDASEASLLDFSFPGSVALNDAGWQARIILRCIIPCEAGTALIGSTCVSCGIGNWSAGGSGACQPCTNGPGNVNYSSVGAGSNNCSWSCKPGNYVLDGWRPMLLVGDLAPPYSIRAVDSNKDVTTVYTPLSKEPLYNFKFMVASQDKHTVYIGSYSINKLNFTNKTFTTLAGLTSAPYRGASDGLGTMASFNVITGAALWSNEAYLLCVDMSNCNVRMVNLLANSSYAVTTLTGSLYSTCGLKDGVGTSALFRYPLDIAVDPTRPLAYVSDSGNNVIRAINLTTAASAVPTVTVTTIAGNGGAASIDGVGTSASIAPTYLAVALDGSALFVATNTGIRRVDLTTWAVTTAASGIRSVYKLAVSSNLQTLFYGTSYKVSSLYLPSAQSFDLAGSPAPALRDGPGSTAAFQVPGLLAVLGETVAPASLCAACNICPVGQYATCNSTGSECLPCASGTTSMPGASACVPCVPGSYGIAGGQCAVCPPGSFSTNFSTSCTNCTAGTYLPRGRGAVVCLTCSAGTYSSTGATACGQCTNLTANGTWIGPGTNSTNCLLGCRPGFNLVLGSGTCSPCGVGTYAAPGSTVCLPCIGLPANANFSRVGFNATGCGFVCLSGYISNGTACLPCPAGTRMVGGACVGCPAGSYASESAAVCLPCNQGNYSLAGASACTVCANVGPYVIFVGRGISPQCQAVCKAGSFFSLAERTCAACPPGTFSWAGATACQPCGFGTWSVAAASACTNCTVLSITASYGANVSLVPFPYLASHAPFPYLEQDGFNVTGITCLA